MIESIRDLLSELGIPTGIVAGVVILMFLLKPVVLRWAAIVIERENEAEDARYKKAERKLLGFLEENLKETKERLDACERKHALCEQETSMLESKIIILETQVNILKTAKA